MQLPVTVNETSFAVCFADATALVLDAISLTGETRRTKLTFALDRLYTAIDYQETNEELALAMGLVTTIRTYERKGQDR